MISPFDGRHRRIALYSHDSQGLGHVRRNLAIAEVPIDLDGLSRIPALVDTLLGAADGAGHVASRQEVTRVCA